MKTEEVSVVQHGSCLGADILGVDLAKPLDAGTFERVREAWHSNLVLRFRGQRLSDPDLVRFSSQFGELDTTPINPYGQRWLPEFPEILVLSNIVVDGKRIGGLGSDEAEWHTDMSYVDHPPMASVLYALEVPPAGGETGFANMYVAYESLPEDLKKAVAGRYIKHDASYNSAGELRKGFSEVANPRSAPGAVHPIVRTHPDTRRKALFLGRRRNAYVEGASLDESEALLDALWAHVANPDLTWYQEWRVDDLLIWDNRCTLHRRNAFDPASRRLMHRAQIRGDKPF